MNLMQKKIAGLETKVKDAAQRYYEDGSSPLTDAAFDAAVGELRELAPDSPIANSVGFGYDVNEDSTPGEKVKHRYGLAGSLTKAYAFNELKESLRNNEVTASLKLDGLSVVCYYNNGALYQALTRGDGEIGIDITEKITHIVPNTLPATSFTGAVRGEILMSHDNFSKFKCVHPEAKNARNSTAGLINAKTVTDEIHLLNVVFYQVVGYETEWGVSSANISMNEIISWLQRMFAPEFIAPFCTINTDETTFMDQMDSLKDQWYDKYPADGIVLTAGVIADNSTDYIMYDAQAFKFDSEEKQTEVVDVEWNLTKTRYLMPRINLKPVELAGTTVQWATGYSAKWIQTFNIYPGCKVKVTKAGEIIPRITSAYDEDSGRWVDCTDTSMLR